MKKYLLLILPLCLICGSLSSQSWVVDYHGSHPSGSTHLYSGFVDADGVTFLSGREGSDTDHPEALVMRINPDGSHSEYVYHKDGYYSNATSVVETDDHNLFVAGNMFDNNDDYVMILLFDKDLNLLEEKTIEKEVEAISFGKCTCAPDSHGNTIVATRIKQLSINDSFIFRGVFYKFDRQGNLLSHRYLIEDYPDPVFFIMNFWLKQMWYNEENETLLCLASGNGGVTSFITLDSAFNYIEEYPIWKDPDETSDHTLYQDCYTDHWFSDDEALFFGGKGNDERCRLRVTRVNTKGEILQFIQLNERPDTIDSPCKNRCMAAPNDSTFYFSFYQHIYPYYPGTACVYLLNDKLDIIGRHLDTSHENFRTSLILPTQDGGCITVNDSCNNTMFLNHGHPVVTKLNRDDFETFTWSIPQQQQVTHQLYPNPTTHLLTIPLDNMDITHARCRICDQYGHTVADREIHGEGTVLQLDVSGLHPGLHFLQIYVNGKTLLSEKFIKE